MELYLPEKIVGLELSLGAAVIKIEIYDGDNNFTFRMELSTYAFDAVKTHSLIPRLLFVPLGMYVIY